MIKEMGEGKGKEKEVVYEEEKVKEGKKGVRRRRGRRVGEGRGERK